MFINTFGLASVGPFSPTLLSIFLVFAKPIVSVNNVNLSVVTFNNFYQWCSRAAAVLAAIAAILILAMSFWITYDVLTRYFLDYSSPWSFDLSEYTLVWVTFLGAPWVLLQDRHVRIELLVDVLPIKAQRILGMLVCVIAIFTCAVLAWRTGLAAMQYLDRNVMMPRIWRIPRIWPYSIIPIGSVLLGFAFCLRFGLYYFNPDPETSLRKRASAGQSTGLDSNH